MVLEQRKTVLKVFLSCVSSQKNKFMELEKRKYRNGIFMELCLTHTCSDCFPFYKGRSLTVITRALVVFLSCSPGPFALLVASFLCSPAIMSSFQLGLSSLSLSTKEHLARIDTVGGGRRALCRLLF